MKYTGNYNLKKPEGTDIVNIEDLNENTDIIDQVLKSHDDALDAHMSDGTQHAKTVRFVIGTSTAGWAEKDCDYLCDGTNDQVEINNAINALPATGGEVIILDGTYNITGRINVNKDNVSIRGSGNATILKRMWDSSFSEGVITLSSVQGCRVENLQIDGNNTTYTSSYNNGIYIHSSSNNNTVTGNTCNNSYHGIFLDSSSNNTVTSNACYNNNMGIYLYSSSNNTITGNTCGDNTYGMYLYSSTNNTITGNTCIRGTGTPGDYSTDQHTIFLSGTDNNYNLITTNNCMGKAVVIGGGTGNTVFNNKWDASDDIQNIEDIIGGTIPSGIITMWSGSISNIPKGWVLCDGQNGTPDLRDRFIVGAGNSYSVGNTGGANSVTLTVSQLPSHNHTAGNAGAHSHTGVTNASGEHTHTYRSFSRHDDDTTDSPGNWGLRSRPYETTSSSGSHSHSLSINSAGSHTHTINNTGGGEPHENRPPYYALAFIMKI